ncbi:MAG: YceI family protein [Parvularculaceae bacterium]
MKKLGTAVATLALGLQGAALAEPVPYEFNTTHTTIRASWNHWGFSRQSIDFTKYAGTLLLDFEKPTNSSVEVEFSLVDGYWVGAPDNDRFETHLASPDLFDIAAFPTAKFKATSFETEDGATGAMRGDLTIKGQTHPVLLDVRLNKRSEIGGRARAGFSASGVVDRSKWGLGYGAPDVPNEVSISIETELVGPEKK